MLGALVVTEMLVSSEHEEPKTQLEKARKVGMYLTQSLGLTSKDLPASLHQRFQAHGVQNFSLEYSTQFLFLELPCSLGGLVGKTR